MAGAAGAPDCRGARTAARSSHLVARNSDIAAAICELLPTTAQSVPPRAALTYKNSPQSAIVRLAGSFICGL